MSHIRTQIRAAIHAALTAAAVAPHIFINRARPIAAADTPCIRITIPGERIAPVGDVGHMLERTVQIAVDAFVQHEPLDDEADALCAAVESALHAAGDFSGLLKQQLTLSSVSYEASETTSPPIGAARMTYEATIYTLAGAPEIAI